MSIALIDLGLRATYPSSQLTALQAVQKLSEKARRFIGLLPRSVVAGFGDDSKLASRNMLAHELGFIDACAHIFVARDQERWDIDGLQCIHRVGAVGHATLGLGNIF